MGPVRAMRSFFNALGLAWWAKIETKEPNVTYWFGPFLTRRGLVVNLSVFVEDLSREGAISVDQRVIRSRRTEPLTISD